MSSTSSSPAVQSPVLPPLYLPEHIVVLVHGNNGAPEDFESVRQTLRGKFSEEEMLIINSTANHTQTSLGVDVGGAKLALEIVTVILKYDLSPKIDTYKFSIVGHSLGGLYARYAIAQVQEELSMLNMDYVSFVTLCTPHLGSRRPRAPSTIKNIYRMSVHKVLASKSIYGQTGVDLLVLNDPRDPDADPPRRPVIDAMSDPDSAFVLALRKFRHCTLMAMADGDVVVPFASASIRNFNPYPSMLLTKKFDDWRWHVRHYGFEKAPAPLLERLNAHVDELLEIDPAYVHAGLDVTVGERFASVEGEYDSDNKHEVEFTFDLIQRQQAAVPWRRVDILVEPSGVKGKLRLHDWPINKMQQPACGALEFIDLLTDILSTDHCLALRRLPPPLTDSMVSTDTIEVSTNDELPSRLSFPKWPVDKNQIGDQVGTFFQNVRNRFGPSAADEATMHGSGGGDQSHVTNTEGASQSFFSQIKSRLSASQSGTIEDSEVVAASTTTAVVEQGTFQEASTSTPSDSTASVPTSKEKATVSLEEDSVSPSDSASRTTQL